MTDKPKGPTYVDDFLHRISERVANLTAWQLLDEFQDYLFKEHGYIRRALDAERKLHAAEAVIAADHANYSFDYCPTCNRNYVSSTGHAKGCQYAAWMKAKGEA